MSLSRLLIVRGATRRPAGRHLAGGERPALVNGAPGAVVFAGERPDAVLGISIVDGRITRIDILADSERLARIDFSAFSSMR